MNNNAAQVGIVIQARTSSTRLPGKMLLPFYKNQGLLQVLLQRLQVLNDKVPVIVATSDSSSDVPIVKIAEDCGLHVFRGDENNVLKRFIDTAEKFHLSKLVRVCADNPFLNIPAIEEIISILAVEPVDYVYYRTSESTPTIKTHYGFWAEGVSVDALKQVQSTTQEQLYIEHLTAYFYTHPEKFRMRSIPIDTEIEQEKNIRLTIDTSDDFNVARQLYSQLMQEKISFEPKEVINIVRQHPEWLSIMSNQIQTNSK